MRGGGGGCVHKVEEGRVALYVTVEYFLLCILASWRLQCIVLELENFLFNGDSVELSHSFVASTGNIASLISFA